MIKTTQKLALKKLIRSFFKLEFCIVRRLHIKKIFSHVKWGWPCLNWKR